MKNGTIFKCRTQMVFRQLLKERGLGYCQIKVGSLAAVHRLYNGEGSMRANAIDRVAKFFGKDGGRVIQAWLEDKANELPTKRNVNIVVK